MFGAEPAHPACLAVVLSGVGGGGSITQELSRNQNSTLAGNSANTACSVVLFGQFPLNVPKEHPVERKALDVLVVRRQKNFSRESSIRESAVS